MFFLSCKSSDLTELRLQDPDLMKGTWLDDYEINYKIEDQTWEMGSEIIFHVLEWNEDKNFIIVKNDEGNAYNADQYSRIDYILFNDMKPYEWGFCLTAYDQKTADDARNTPPANGKNPKSGCNGFPFSRMKRF